MPSEVGTGYETSLEVIRACFVYAEPAYDFLLFIIIYGMSDGQRRVFREAHMPEYTASASKKSDENFLLKDGAKQLTKESL